ncbi:MAG: TrkA family potassium uptake protein [Firmicutes bacterium]|nr:TrkA family potassium uptake protein [Bacillota bacterium]
MARHEANTFLIVGAGRFGKGAARELLAGGQEVLLVDKREQPLEEMQDFPNCIVRVGDASDMEFLEEIGAQEAKAAIVAIGDNELASLHVTSNLKDMGLYVVAKATSRAHGTILERLRADHVVYPEYEAGRHQGRLLMGSSLLEKIDLSNTYSMDEYQIRRPLADKTLAELNLTQRFGVQIVAILRGEALILPRADEVLRIGDKVLVLGESTALEKIERFMSGE